MTIVKANSVCLAALIAALVTAGCGTTGSAPGSSSNAAAKAAAPSAREGYLCCNLHYEKDWISDSNYADLPMIPVGTPAKTVDKPGRNYTKLSVDGKPMRLGLDYGREQMTIGQYIEKVIVTEDPKEKMKSFPADVQTAIGKGMVMKGMTKEQVIMAVGYPLANENPRMEVPVWRYWVNWTDEYQVIWDDNGTAKDITGPAGTLARIVYTPKK